jgi:hypothetical protein
MCRRDKKMKIAFTWNMPKKMGDVWNNPCKIGDTVRYKDIILGKIISITSCGVLGQVTMECDEGQDKEFTKVCKMCRANSYENYLTIG